MRRTTNADLVTGARNSGKVAKPTQVLCILAAVAAMLPASSAHAVLLDFTANPPGPGYGGTGTITGVGISGAVTATYTTIDTKPAGTGVFDPFLTLQRKGTEAGYNTSQGGNGQGYLDTKRVPQWTHDLHLSALALVDIPGTSVQGYAFELDANETGSGNLDRLLSVDQIRVYVSGSDTANSVANNTALLDNLGNLVYAQNAAILGTENWVKIDASRTEGGSTSGSGSSDLIVYIPKAAFDAAMVGLTGPSVSDPFVYFFNLNGAHVAASGANGAGTTSSMAGYEEWRAIKVPDGGTTLLLLGSSLTALGLLRRKMA